MSFDVVILTEGRYEHNNPNDWYTQQVHTEDNLLLDALKKEGLAVTRQNWANKDFEWNTARSAIFRSTWDYFDQFSVFAPWLKQTRQNTRLFNDADLIHWNIDKHYLGNLIASGVHCVPTFYIEKGDTRVFTDVLETLSWGEYILKPVVSGAARHTYRFKQEQTQHLAQIFTELIEQEGLMLQPFQNNVLQYGEISIMVIDGKATHAIRKTPKSGDFRVQDDHGGMVHEHIPTPDEVTFAEKAVAAVPYDVLYARVDIIRDNAGELAIMELEMIEPELFFRFNPTAAKQLASGLARRLSV